MTVRPMDEERVATYVENILEAYGQATPEQVAQGMEWYADAREIAAYVGASLGVSLQAGAGIIAALSPRKTWEQNIRQAIEYANGITPKTVRAQVEACDRIVAADEAGEDPLEAVCVPGSTYEKTPSFARNIAGDHEAVTVDVWMLKAAGITDREAPTVVQYREIREAVRRLAVRKGITPAACQAIAWIGARGSHD